MTAGHGQLAELGRSPWAGVLLALAVATAIVVPIEFGDAPQDDAYISYTYARNFARGHGLVYNAGEPAVEGYTNFLWTVGIGWGMRLGVDPERAVPWAGLLFTVATVFATFALARRLGSTAWFAALAALLFASRPTITVHAMGGMETPLFGLLVLLGLYWRLGETRGTRTDWASSVALALAALTRPEGVLVYVLLELGELLWLLREHAAKRAELGPAIRQALRRAVPFALIVSIHLTWRHATYGGWVPNTFYAKVSPGLATWSDGLRYVGSGLLFFGPLFLAAPYFMRSAPRFVRSVRLCLWLSTLYTAYVVYVGGDYIPSFRFLWPVMPIWSALAATAAARLVEPREAGPWRGLWPQRTFTAAGVSVAFLALTIGHAWHEYVGGHRWVGMHERHRALIAGGKMLKKVLPGDAWIAVTAAGRIPYFAERRTLDMMGLSDAHIARAAAMTEASEVAGHLKGDGKYVLDQKPDAILFLRLVVRGAPLATSPIWPQIAKQAAFGVSESQITDDERFYTEYRLCSLPVGDGKTWLNLFVRESVFAKDPPQGLIVAQPEPGP